MNNPADDIIKAQPAPLTHLGNPAGRVPLRERLDWRSAAVAALVVAALITLVIWQPASDRSQPANQNTSVAVPTQGNLKPETVNNPDAQLPPFAQTQRERARSQAQEALAKFVELQIELEENMQVDAWGATELAAAMAQARTGDEEFLSERFESALTTYETAAAQLKQVIDLGNKKFQEHLTTGMQLIEALSPQESVAALEAALVIKPNDANAKKQYQRAMLLPQIIGKLRTAKNHELSGRYNEALAIYAEIQQLDPMTPGIDALKNAAAEAQAGNNLTGYISKGFAALNEARFSDAKSAFKQALQLDPDNAIAKGGLEQVAQRNDLAIITRHRQDAEAALAEENWQTAIDEYQAVLDLDANVQFALNGIADARAHLRAQRLLDKIANEPQKLSAEKLYLEAQDILQKAKALPLAGPKLVAATAEVDRLLILYRDPVDVVLLSDNATDVIMSNVGKLGYFERKTLTLRPGQYTIRGSQDGCRDIFLNVEVLPGIAPLDLSCAQPINR